MADGQGTRPSRRIWPAILVGLVSLLPDLGAAIPGRSYFFRDFSVTFYPLRLFVARELREGRFPFWNPYIYEGSFALPTFYPLDLLHVLWPGPAGVSWLLTLHLPLAAVGMYLLAREHRGDEIGAVVAGSVYALGGLSLSSLNLYVFLQALALAPFLVLVLGRAIQHGGRAIGLGAIVVSVSISTLAVEFVAQAVLLGVAVALVVAPWRLGLRRAGLTVALGAGLAAVPIAVTTGLVRETVRGSGFGHEIALANAVHPVALLQTIVPDLFGSLADPVGAWWGGAFFSKGLPYFLSLYLGPLALALAWVGRGALPTAIRRTLAIAAVLGLWYALGERAGLASWLSTLPGMSAVRFPSKAFFLVHFVVALGAGLGASRLRQGEGWSHFAGATGVVALVLAAVVTAASSPGVALAAWAGVQAEYGPVVLAAVARSASVALAVAVAGAVCGMLAMRFRRYAAPLAVLVAALAVLDLSNAGAGMNPQVPASFFDPLPEMQALGLASPRGGRVFSYGLDFSPGFRQRTGAGNSRAAFFLNRQILGPYNNVLDRVEATEATDLTSFVPRPRELAPADYDPALVGSLLPWLRNAAVEHVLSLDPLQHEALRLLAEVPVVGEWSIRAYSVADPTPPGYVACKVLVAPTPDEALARSYQGGFDLRSDVVLERPGPATCVRGRADRERMSPGEERFATESDGDGYLVVRASYASGWRARVDGRPVAVLRANGKHRAVAIAAGRHDVIFSYEPPGLRMGLLIGAACGLALALVFARPPLRGEPVARV